MRNKSYEQILNILDLPCSGDPIWPSSSLLSFPIESQTRQEMFHSTIITKFFTVNRYEDLSQPRSYRLLLLQITRLLFNLLQNHALRNVSLLIRTTFPSLPFIVSYRWIVRTHTDMWKVPQEHDRFLIATSLI